MNKAWTTSSDIAAKVRRHWDDGTLLRAHADGRPIEPIEIRLRGPRASEIGDDLEAVRAWVAELDAGRQGDRKYALQWQSVGGRSVGRNEVPAKASVSSLEQAWALLGVGGAVRRFDAILSLVRASTRVHAWVSAHPLAALELEHLMPQLLAAHEWLDSNRHSGRYLREISAPGVDTKFAEKHRAVLAPMLGVPSNPAAFLSALGLRSKPEYLRIRPAASLGLPDPLTELAVRAEELAGLALEPRTALVIENEVTYLSVDVPEDGVVIWGKGFEVDRVGRLPWLVSAQVLYWGDLDTHGFAILDRLRAWLPQTRSVLMDRETLLEHRDRWVTEERPARSSLSRLSSEEAELYADLVVDALGDRVRLEQERVDWAWVMERL